MQNCYNTGKVPRDLMNEQSERLTTKHIQTLSFLQEIVQENKDLKAKVEELQVIMCVHTIQTSFRLWHLIRER